MRFVWFLTLLVGCAAPGAKTPPATSTAKATATPTAPSQDTVWLDVVATTDTHGHVDARQTVNKLADGSDVKVARGGAALLSGYVEILRKRDPNRVLLIDGGDLFTGTLTADLTEGRSIIDAMNALGYDAAAVGNHEFDFGPIGEQTTPEKAGDDPRGALKAAAKAAKFPLLGANLAEPRGEQWSRPFTIVERDGIKIAIVGGTTDGLRATTIVDNLAELQITKLREAVARNVYAARQAGATVVIVTVHAGSECRANRPLTERDQDEHGRCDRTSELFDLANHLAKDPGTRPDLLIGGHTHKELTAVVAGIPMVQAEPKGRGFALARLEIARGTNTPTGRYRIEPTTLTCSHHVVGTSKCPIDPSKSARFEPATYLGEPVVANPAVVAAVRPHLDKADAIANKPLGARAVEKVNHIYSHEAALGNLVADTLRAYAKADVGVMNGGGIRNDLPAGELTYGHAFEVMPFHNRLAVVTLLGAQMRKLLLQNLKSDRGILSLSGVTVDARCFDGKPQIDVHMSDGKLLDDARAYRIATVDFLVKGGDDFADFDKLSPVAGEAPFLRDLLIAELKRRKTIEPIAYYDKRAPRIRIEGGRPLRCSAVSAKNEWQSPLAFMQGCWQETGKATLAEQYRMLERELVGTSQFFDASGKVTTKERTVITEKNEQITLTPTVNGKVSVGFILQPMATPGRAVFENGAHDFPQRIIYRSDGPDRLIARIEGKTPDGKTKAIEWQMQRAACPTTP